MEGLKDATVFNSFGMFIQNSSFKIIMANPSEDKKGGLPSLNPNLKKLLAKKQRQQLSAKSYIEAILNGDRVSLGQAITIIESTRQKDQELATEIVDGCLPYSNRSIRIGITGAPGVGKSTFVESFGSYLLTQNKKLAVLAVDPSSHISGGSILGDKTRMDQLSATTNAFIRPSPSGDSLGGVARKTREAMILCEAAGYDTILVETVGVGQSEFMVHSMVDCFLLLLLPGAGDELQGIKRGIVEMADMVLINKADGERKKLAERTKKDYRNALHLFPPKASKWTPKAIVCSALEQQGMEDIWKTVVSYFKLIQDNNFFQQNRTSQSKYWLHTSIQQGLQDAFFENEKILEELKKVEKAVLDNQLSPFKGASQLLKFFKQVYQS